jgi:hypothetical protein
VTLTPGLVDFVGVKIIREICKIAAKCLRIAVRKALVGKARFGVCNVRLAKLLPVFGSREFLSVVVALKG